MGAPCGVMDQMAVTLGAESELLALLCQPAELQNPVAIPANVRFWGLDSGAKYNTSTSWMDMPLSDLPCCSFPAQRLSSAGERHSVGGEDYGTVRTAAFMGLRILSSVAAGNHVDAAAQTDDQLPSCIGALNASRRLFILCSLCAKLNCDRVLLERCHAEQST